MLLCNTWNHLTVCKKIALVCLKCYLRTIHFQIIYIYIYIYTKNLTLNNPEGLVCHKTQLTYTFIWVKIHAEKVALFCLKCYLHTIHLQIIYIYIYIKDFAINNPQGLACHKTQPTYIFIWVMVHGEKDTKILWWQKEYEFSEWMLVLYSAIF